MENLQQARKALTTETQRWQDEVARLRKVYEDWAEKAGGHHHELLDRRDTLKRERKALESQLEDLSAAADHLPDLVAHRDELLDQLDAAHERIYERRSEKYQEITAESGGRLKLEVTRGANRGAFASKLIELCQGSYARREDIKKLVKRINPRELFWYLFTGDSDGIRTTAEVSKDLVGRLLGAFESCASEDILALQYETLVEDTPDIQMRKDDEKYYGLDGLSIGQKCTALLIVALSDQKRPILVDQPEDALDIASVYADVTLQIRRRKLERQFILTTHNPTVAVAGDADRFLILKATATRGTLASQGAIERDQVKDEVILHLEGGRESYGLKTRKYASRFDTGR